MYSRFVVFALAATMLLTGCKSNNRKIKPSRIAPSHHAMSQTSKYMTGDPRHAVDPAYDPFFDRSRHPVKPKQMRGFPHFRTTVWTDSSRDHFSYADIYANTGMQYQLDTGDVVRIDVFEQSNLSRLYRIDGGGFVSIPLIGSIQARGMTTRILEQEVAIKLRRSYIKDPQVTVEISTHRPFYILGEVRNSGKYPYVLGMTVETAVAIAGGYSPRANQKKVMVIRRLGRKLVRTYVPNHYQIKPGDTLKIVERLF